MPESIHYVVTETSEVKVIANDEAGALAEAERRFLNPTIRDRHTTYPVRRIETTIKRTL